MARFVSPGGRGGGTRTPGRPPPQTGRPELGTRFHEHRTPVTSGGRGKEGTRRRGGGEAGGPGEGTGELPPAPIGAPRAAAVPSPRRTYRLYTGPCNRSRPLCRLRSHRKCSHNRGQRRPAAPRRTQSPGPPATRASSGEASAAPSSSPGGKGGAAAGRPGVRGPRGCARRGGPALLCARGGSSAGPRRSGVRRHAGAVGTAERARTACSPPVAERSWQGARGWAEGR